jgi:SWI/SNF-related matrix-associated actin-dependent regulator of chromatin subfamily A-like protein 1
VSSARAGHVVPPLVPRAAELPPYLLIGAHQAPPLATLSKTTGPFGDHWVIKGDPQVVSMAKRLFPAAEGRGAGIAKFPMHQRLFGDLIWFMQRFPIEIDADARAAFEGDYANACAFVLKRQDIVLHPQSRLPDELFLGVLRTFQQEGLDWVMTNRRTLLADDMGLGKTVTACAVLATEPAWPALVTPPPHLIRHWRSFVSRFMKVANEQLGPLFSEGLKIHVIEGTNRKREPLPFAHIYLCHYLLLRHWRHQLLDAGVQRVVFDECQDLRHAGTEKYSAASAISQSADIVLGLSGTPIYGRGGEIWNVLNAIDYHCLGDWDTFTREWCNGYGKDVVKDPDLLGACLKREGLMLRRTKGEVAGELPKKERIVVSIDSDEGLFSKLVATAVQLAKQAQGTKDHLERGRLQREAIEQTRRATGVAKAASVAAFVRSMMEAGEPTVVFAHHHDVVDILVDELKEFSPVLITGRQNGNEKWEAQEAFRAGKSKLCIVGLRATTGIDGLQEVARVVVFAELDWSPAVHSQGEDRLHRDGQKNPVLCYYPVVDNGTDPEILELLGLKIAQFIGLMGDTPDTEEDRDIAQTVTRDHMRRVLAKLIRRDDVNLAIDEAEIGALLEETVGVVEESGVPA